MMCTVHAAWRRCLCFRRAILVAGVGWLSAREKNLGKFEGGGDELSPYFAGVQGARDIPRAGGNGAIQDALLQ